MEQAPKLCFQPEVEEELGGVRKAKANVQRSAAPSQASTPQRALLVLKYLSLGTKISIRGRRKPKCSALLHLRRCQYLFFCTCVKVQRSAAPSQASTPQRALLVLKYLTLGTKISNLCCASSGLHAAASTFGTKISNFRY